MVNSGFYWHKLEQALHLILLTYIALICHMFKQTPACIEFAGVLYHVAMK